ncbi:hypothetical protein SteCoe_4076 [Stentor coeruleus]|uniref:EF-hand domain-containing protein n=1 Tax=Stentor coeruleus TaxID=5963 RepID=A0A1R2CVF9_9CILI|nr:hypothetical protein SteCoe_4076 [Stentor coeruleus]
MHKKLLNFFSLVSVAEEQVEILREVLCQRCNYEIFSIYRDIDYRDKGYFDFYDLKDLLRNSEVEDDEILNLLHQWSGDINGRVQYRDFVKWVLPYNKFPKPISEHSGRLSFDIRYSIKRLLEKEIDFVRKFEEYKQEFSDSIGESYLEAFKILGNGHSTMITKENLYNFLVKNGFRTNFDRLEGIFRRFDKDSNGFITYDDFVDSFNTCRPYGKLQKSKSNKEFARNIQELTRSTQEITRSTQDMFRENTHAHERKQNIKNNQIFMNPILKNMFEGFIEIEKTLEAERIKLALRKDFTVEAVFSLFDRKRKKRVSENDIDIGLMNMGIPTFENPGYYIVRHYDKDRDEMLDLSDFYRIFLPKRSYYGLIVKNRSGPSKLSIETLELLNETFRIIISLEQQTESLRSQIKISGIALKEIFNSIKGDSPDNLDYITTDNFREFLIANKLLLTNIDLNGLIERFDNNGDGKITYKEFARVIF